MVVMPAPLSGDQLKVVAHLADGTLIKGFTLGIPDFYKNSLGKQPHTQPPEKIELRLAGDDKTTQVELSRLKALFFVKTFEGSTSYSEIKFFKAHPLLEGLWVRLQFNDNESTEGVVYNSLDFVNNTGFFLKPPDPHSNNEVVYVLKKSLKDFRILGVRNTY